MDRLKFPIGLKNKEIDQFLEQLKVAKRYSCSSLVLAFGSFSNSLLAIKTDLKRLREHQFAFINDLIFEKI